MKLRFIYNPFSGRNRRRPQLAHGIREFIGANRLDADFVMTEGPGHATELARAAVLAGHQIVVAVGGDGTMNEVAQGLIDSPAALALIPCGSGNGLALHLGVPRSPLDALRLVAGDSRRGAIDTGVVNGRPFFNAMGLGLDADISRRFHRITRRGLPAYIRLGAESIRHLHPERIVIQHGAQREEFDALLVAVANSDQYGNNARIAPGARVDDGVLDLTLVKPVGLLAAAGVATRLFLGNIDRSAHVIRMHGPSFVIERATDGVIHTDGEPHFGTARLEIAVRPRSLRVLIPVGSRAVADNIDRAALGFALKLS